MTIELPPAASADHLTTALRNAGVLGDGRVRDVTVDRSFDTVISHIFRLRLDYDGPTPAAPESVILKIAHSNFAGKLWQAGWHETAFYTNVAPAMQRQLTPRCYEASFEPETKAWHLLLEDLTDSHHVATVWPLPPAVAQCESIVRALARMHAAWWDDPRLGVSVGSWADREAMAAHDRQFAENFARFSDALGDRLPPARHDLFRRLNDAAPRLQQRYHSHHNHTLTHGDAHTWNFLLPKDPDRDDVRLFDFDQWRINAGSSDLAYMMALQWYP